MSNRILSWKINNGTYAYIFPINDSYISSRIPDDSPKWKNIIETISEWTQEDYVTNFERMNEEVATKYGKTIGGRAEDYWDFSNNTSSSNTNVNIVMLAGSDGSNGASGGGGTSISDTDKNYIMNDVSTLLRGELTKLQNDIDAKNEAVKSVIAQKVSETISEAKRTIAETSASLATLRSELVADLSGATVAINKAAALFDMGEENITAETIKDALSSVGKYGEKIDALSGNITSFKTDYDMASETIGSIVEGEDVTAGLFTRIASSLNAVSGTAGTVSSWMVASAGTIGDSATWINTHSSAVTEAQNWINASAGTIGSTLSYVNGDGVNSLSSTMDVLKAQVITEASTMIDSGVTNVKNLIDGVSGIVSTNINRLDNLSGSLTSIGSEFNATKAEFEQYILKTDELSGTAIDLRESWNIMSGMLKSVSVLVPARDEHGRETGYIEMNNVKYDVYNENGVWVIADSGVIVGEGVEVEPYYECSIGSYISQTANDITLEVLDDSGKTAGLRASIVGDEATMSLMADKIAMSGNVIMGAMSALTANIGGILIGDGVIETVSGETDTTGIGSAQTCSFRLDGRTGKITAENAEIKGTIKADSGFFNNGTLNNVTINGSISNPVILYRGTVIELLNENNTAETYEFNRNYLKDVAVDNKQYYAWTNDANSAETFFTLTRDIEVGSNAFFKAAYKITDKNEIKVIGMRSLNGQYSVVSVSNELKGNNSLSKHDNLAMVVDTEKRVFGPDELDWTTENSGRLIRLINAEYSANTSTGSAVLYAPDGQYFIEDGERMSSLRFSNEVIEMIGYGTTETFYGWIVLNRKDVNTEKSYGTSPKFLYQGIMRFTDNKPTYLKLWTPLLEHSYDNPNLDIKINNSGVNSIIYIPVLDYRKLDDLDNWEVYCTGGYPISKEYDKENNRIKFTLKRFSDTNTLSFQIVTTAFWAKMI